VARWKEIIMERFYKDPRTPLRMREGPLGAYVDAFAQHLSDDGYAKASSRYALQLLANLGRWLHRRKITAQQITSEHLGHYLQYRSVWTPLRDAAIVRRLFNLLLDNGVVARTRQSSLRRERLEEQFRLYLERERRLPRDGVPLSAVRPALSRHCLADGGLRLDALRAADVVGFVQREAARLHHPKRAKLMTAALRSFLQYAHYTGLISVDLRLSVPTVASWSMAELPRALPADDVQRLLVHCDRHTALGRRNWAILLLLVRLGLRAGEVVGLALEDLDWEVGNCGFGPTQEIGIGCRYPRTWGSLGRLSAACAPALLSRRVFVRMRAPHRGFASSVAISCIVRRALERAGLIRPTKAHLLRHSVPPKCYGRRLARRDRRRYATVARRPR
jgi:site-specific recombinase XerD